MLRYERQFRLLAYCFAALAGFVDAIGFVKSGGLFVAFMTGNSTRLAIGIAEVAPVAAAAATLIGLFVLGVTLNVLVSSAAKRRKPAAATVVAALLITAATLESFGSHLAVIGTLCVAMGASNAIFQRDREVSIGVTYMTGTLVRLGHRIADTLIGGDRTAWLPYFLLWLSLVLGGIGGAISYLAWGTLSLWGAAASSVALAYAMWRLTAVVSPQDHQN